MGEWLRFLVTEGLTASSEAQMCMFGTQSDQSTLNDVHGGVGVGVGMSVRQDH